MPDLRESILLALKQQRAASIAELAATFDVTFEAIRQHCIALEDDGIVTRRVVRNDHHDPLAGRPAAMYSLTDAGENQFPKLYDALASSLIAIAERDTVALETALGAYTDERVDHWRGRMHGRMIERRLELLRGFYTLDDPFMTSGSDERGLFLVENNCPYYNAAIAHPSICSTSVTALSRLVGYEIAREERLQEGDRRCVFRVDLEKPVDETERGFRREPEA